MKFTTVQKAFGAIIIANIIWSAASVIFKISLTNIPPFTLAFLRFALAPLLLLCILGKRVEITLHNRRDFFTLIAYALTGITANIIFYFLGLQRTYSINSTIIAAGAPLLTLFLAHTFLREKISFRKVLGFTFGAIGLAFIVFEPLKIQQVGGSILGNIFLILAVLSAVVETIIGRSILQRYDPLVFTFWAFIIGAASFFPLAVYEYITMPTLYSLLDWRGFMGIAYGAIFSSAIAYSLFAWGLSKISATDTSLITYLDPVIGTMLGYVVLHEPITFAFLLGAILIFLGIYVAQGRIHYHPFHKLLHDKVPPVETIPPQTRQLHPKEVIASLYDKKML